MLGLRTSDTMPSQLAMPLVKALGIFGLVCAIVAGFPDAKTYAAEEFNDVQCQVDFADKDLCNLKFFSKFMSARLIKSGSNVRIPYSSIYRWSYENASLRKMKGIFSTSVEHIHVFTIFYRDKDLGSPEKLIIDFDDIKYVPGLKSLLIDILPQAQAPTGS